MNTKKVDIVVVTFNRKKLLVECIENLLNQAYKNTRIIIVDNASTDGTKEYISQYIQNDQISYYNTGKNLGGAGGFNFGLKIAAQDDCDYICLMDDDTIVNDSSIESLVNSAKKLNDDFGFLCSYVKYTDGTYCKMNRPNVDKFYWIEDCELIKQGLLRVDRATFVSFFIKKDTVVEMGLPIKEFFIWSDDTEYSQRIAKKNKCFFDINSVVTHKMINNHDTRINSLIDEETDRVNRYYYNFRNRFYIAKSNGKKEVIKYILQFININISILFKCKKAKLKKFYIIWKGFIAGITFNPPIEYVQNL